MKLSVITPLLSIRGYRVRNWNVIYRHLIPILQQREIEWVVPEHDGHHGSLSGVRHISIESYSNIAELLNTGWKSTDADMFCFLDADLCMSHAAWNHAFDECWKFDAYSPYQKYVPLSQRATSRVIQKVINGDQPLITAECRSGCFFGGISFIKRSVMEAIGGWDKRFIYWCYGDYALEKIVRTGDYTMHWDNHQAIHLYHHPSALRTILQSKMKQVYMDNYL